MATIIGTDPNPELGLTGNDNLSSETAGDVILGLGGDDILQAIGDNITLDGGAGNDELSSFGFGSTQIGGAGNDTLTGGPGDDVFQYSFDLMQGEAESETFTDFIRQVDDALLIDNSYTQSFFSTQYTAWLEHLVDTFDLGSDVDGDGVVEVGLNQNDADPDATPFIEGVSAEDLDAMFDHRDDVFLNTGKVTQERFYSNSFSTGDDGTTVTSGDGTDTIFGFTDSGNDVLRFDFTADDDWNTGMSADEQLDFLQSFFAVASVDSDGMEGIDSTKISVGEWSTTLQGQLYGDADADGFSDVFNHVDIYVNLDLIG